MFAFNSSPVANVMKNSTGLYVILIANPKIRRP